MPFLQFFITLPAYRVRPKEFIQKTAVLLTQTFKDKPMDRIGVHLLTDQKIFSGRDPNGNEHIAYAVLRSVGQVGADENRKTIEVMSKHVKQELGINSSQFKMFFIDLDPNLYVTKGRILADLGK